MVLSYAEGLAKVLRTAHESQTQDALGRVAGKDVISPKSIPKYDTSAMDGYAICSEVTKNASPQTPVLLGVLGTIAAGDDPEEVIKQVRTDAVDTTNHCLEIMTGAIFPDGYDACVKIEDTVPENEHKGRSILIMKPVSWRANRRSVGCDILEGDVIIPQGKVVESSHILPLASVGIDSVPIARRPHVGVWSTGKEMVNGRGATRDTNGPYLTAAVKEMGLHADFLGVLADDPSALRDALQNAADSADFDVLITSGAVSKGKFDHIRGVLGQIGAEIIFHGLGVRPGHPVLFALVPGARGKTAFFGLPGNPGASSACFRFLIVPYLRALQGQPVAQPMLARLVRQPTTTKTKHGCHAMQDTDCFRHGVLSITATAKLGPFITANCWIHLRPHHSNAPASPTGADLVECYPLSPMGTIRFATTVLN
ncbi:MoeA, N-terminal and linker domain-containing protein [Corynascus novoguineensis]|uniref:molybdopterin adenylyltransferase n=1 Tax=Corynascus novoguineensis TaxID=1126955 RepID=A0AAN7CKA5_9PEZI|nr:MoeA, N-terminal and linker domain-containing protein [Corynascus novoguineensis]